MGSTSTSSSDEFLLGQSSDALEGDIDLKHLDGVDWVFVRHGMKFAVGSDGTDMNEDTPHNWLLLVIMVFLLQLSFIGVHTDIVRRAWDAHNREYKGLRTVPGFASVME